MKSTDGVEVETLTDAEAQAEQLILNVKALREPVADGQARLSALKAKRIEMESFQRIDSMTLAEKCHEHDRQIAITEHAVQIDTKRLHAEIDKAKPIEQLLEEQTSSYRANPDTRQGEDGFLYNARFESEISTLVRESDRRDYED